MALSTKSCLSYFGSDSEVAASLAALLGDCSHITIPFVGGASILPHLRARSLVCNDLNGLAINFYRALGGVYGDDVSEQLRERCYLTLSHPDEMERAAAILDDWNEFKPVESLSIIETAWAYWALCWIGRKGKGGTKHLGGMPSVRRTANGGSNASRLTAAAKDLTDWAKHFKRCEWTEEDFRHCLTKVKDGEKIGVYCDPPWVGAGRNYLHGFSHNDHIDLAQFLGRLKESTVVVRYGDDPIIRQLYKDWNIIEASSRTQSNAVKGELWITNKEAAS